MPVAHRPWHDSGVGECGALVDQRGDQTRKEIHFHPLSAPRGSPGLEGGQNSDAGVQPRQHVDERHPYLGRRAILLPGYRHEPADSLGDEVVPGSDAPGPGPNPETEQ